MPKFALKIATPQDEASVCDLLKASYPVLMSSRYDEAILADALPMITQANPSLLSAGTYYLAESEVHELPVWRCITPMGIDGLAGRAGGRG